MVRRGPRSSPIRYAQRAAPRERRSARRGRPGGSPTASGRR
jgi:hypothetical protein